MPSLLPSLSSSRVTAQQGHESDRCHKLGSSVLPGHSASPPGSLPAMCMSGPKSAASAFTKRAGCVSSQQRPTVNARPKWQSYLQLLQQLFCAHIKTPVVIGGPASAVFSAVFHTTCARAGVWRTEREGVRWRTDDRIPAALRPVPVAVGFILRAEIQRRWLPAERVPRGPGLHRRRRAPRGRALFGALYTSTGMMRVGRVHQRADRILLPRDERSSSPSDGRHSAVVCAVRVLNSPRIRP
jgi:hypothetical protein